MIEFEYMNCYSFLNRGSFFGNSNHEQNSASKSARTLNLPDNEDKNETNEITIKHISYKGFKVKLKSKTRKEFKLDSPMKQEKKMQEKEK